MNKSEALGPLVKHAASAGELPPLPSGMYASALEPFQCVYTEIEMRAYARTALAAQSAAPAEKRLIGWRTSNYLMETSDLKQAQNWEVHYEILPIFEGDLNTKLIVQPAAPTNSPTAQGGLKHGKSASQDQGLSGTVSSGNRLDERNQDQGAGVGASGRQTARQVGSGCALDEHRGHAPAAGIDGTDPQCGETGIFLTGTAAAPTGEMPPLHKLMAAAQVIVEAKPTWKRFINGTPLANDIAVWMANFARAALAAQPAPDDVVRDAARMRWLAAHCRSTREHWGGRWSIVIDGPAPKSNNSEDDFFDAIDAAIAAAPGGKHDTV